MSSPASTMSPSPCTSTCTPRSAGAGVSGNVRTGLSPKDPDAVGSGGRYSVTVSPRASDGRGTDRGTDRGTGVHRARSTEPATTSSTHPPTRPCGTPGVDRPRRRRAPPSEQVGEPPQLTLELVRRATLMLVERVLDDVLGRRLPLRRSQLAIVVEGRVDGRRRADRVHQRDREERRGPRPAGEVHPVQVRRS